MFGRRGMCCGGSRCLTKVRVAGAERMALPPNALARPWYRHRKRDRMSVDPRAMIALNDPFARHVEHALVPLAEVAPIPIRYLSVAALSALNVGLGDSDERGNHPKKTSNTANEPTLPDYECNQKPHGGQDTYCKTCRPNNDSRLGKWSVL